MTVIKMECSSDFQEHANWNGYLVIKLGSLSHLFPSFQFLDFCFSLNFRVMLLSRTTIFWLSFSFDWSEEEKYVLLISRYLAQEDQKMFPVDPATKPGGAGITVRLKNKTKQKQETELGIVVSIDCFLLECSLTMHAILGE